MYKLLLVGSIRLTRFYAYQNYWSMAGRVRVALPEVGGGFERRHNRFVWHRGTRSLISLTTDFVRGPPSRRSHWPQIKIKQRITARGGFFRIQRNEKITGVLHALFDFPPGPYEIYYCDPFEFFSRFLYTQNWWLFRCFAGPTSVYHESLETS